MKYAWMVVALAACSHSPDEPVGATPQPDNTLPFPITIDDFFRATDGCGNPSLAFLPEDDYGLDVLGGDGALRTGFNLMFRGTTKSQADELDVGAVRLLSSSTGPDGITHDDYGQTGTTADDATVSMEWLQGSQPETIDATPVTAATVRFGALPTHEGELMSFDVTIAFMDGGVVDLHIVEPVDTITNPGCPAG